ncbi:MFS transporter [Novosphingobium sp. Leaf2]|uniref:MFS transporter n=1 Tax=Novosphingobium sp. Leaf2 TaxID=1735670 RepID=UPI000701B765|nr:MFS transporter [Novosphingobium sp. Leaf2]KQM21534.1 glucose transporter [Novosphingobium sp. Leaf2]
MSVMTVPPVSISAPKPPQLVAKRLFWLSIGVFFVGGFLSSAVSLLVPQLKAMLTLDYKGALLIQLAFHSSYLFFALPAALAVVRVGYMRAIALGLSVMTAGCLSLAVAQGARQFVLVLGALLLLSAGQTVLQIASNTVVTVIGPSRGAAFRLTLLQGFNSLGTVLGPLLSAPFLLADVAPGSDAAVRASLPFVSCGAVLAALGALYLGHRELLRDAASGSDGLPERWNRKIFAVLRDPRLLWGTVAIFVYVGAEVTIGTLMTNVLMLPERLSLSPVSAGRMVSLYWAGAMVGRFAGAWLMTRVGEAALLMYAALGAVLLTGAAIVLPGLAGSAALIAVGLCNAIMYPTIYAMAMPRDARLAPLASMWLCMAVVGGAIVPMLTGVLADAIGLLASLLLPALCYVAIAVFAIACTRPREIAA